MPLPLPEETEQWRQRLEEQIFPAVVQWMDRFQGRPVQPAEGSTLAGVDAIGAPLPPSTVIYTQLMNATEYLDAIRRLCEASTAAVLYPPYFTLLRTALISSATATYVLKAPDQRTQQVNALRIMHYDLEEQRKVPNSVPDGLGDSQRREQAHQQLATQREQVEAAAHQLGVLPHHLGLNTTDVIKQRPNTFMTTPRSSTARYARPLTYCGGRTAVPHTARCFHACG